MKRASLKKITISALIVVVIGGGGYFAYNTFFKTKATSTSRYLTETATVGTLNVTIPGTGTVVSAATKDVVLPNSGKLTNFKVSTGSAITAGTSLGTVVDSALQNQINTDQLKLTQAKQQLAAAQQQKNSTLQNDQLKLTAANQSVNNANSQLAADTASKNSNNAETINKDNSSIQSAQISVQQAQNAITNDTNTENNNISSQNISVQQAQNTLNTDLATQSNENIVAPISGTFENVANQNGDNVSSGKTLGTIEDLTHLQLQVPVDELDISKISVGQKVDITFDDVKNKKYTGTINAIPDTGTTSNSVTTYTITVSIDDSTGLKLGMNANVTINVQTKANALMVPIEAVQTKNGNKYVLEPSTSSSSGSSWSGNGSGSGSSSRNRSSSSTSKTSGKLVQVQTGISNQDYVEITSGLKEGQKY